MGSGLWAAGWAQQTVSRQEDPGVGEASSEARLGERTGEGPWAGHVGATTTSHVTCGHLLSVISITGNRWPLPRATQCSEGQHQAPHDQQYCPSGTGVELGATTFSQSGVPPR